MPQFCICSWQWLRTQSSSKWKTPWRHKEKGQNKFLAFSWSTSNPFAVMLSLRRSNMQWISLLIESLMRQLTENHRILYRIVWISSEWPLWPSTAPSSKTAMFYVVSMFFSFSSYLFISASGAVMMIGLALWRLVIGLERCLSSSHWCRLDHLVRFWGSSRMD